MCLAESVVLLYFLQTILAVAASLGVVVFSTPAFLLPLVLIAIVYWFIGLLYVTTSRELKRMDVSLPSIARSQVCDDDTNRQTEHHPFTPIYQFLRSPRRHVHHQILRRQRAIYAQDITRTGSEYKMFLVPMANESCVTQLLQFYRITSHHFCLRVCFEEQGDECGSRRILDLLCS
jgi:hypothetical protein